VPRLAGRFTCHVIDLPGVGQTESDPGAPLDLVSHGESLSRMADAIGLASYAVVAHDSGGIPARLLAVADRRVTRLVLGNTEIPGHVPALVAAIVMLLKLPFGAAAIRGLMRSRAFRRSSLGFGGCFEDPAFLDGDFHDLFVRPLVEDDRWAARQLRVLETLHADILDRLREAHARIHVPVALVWGDADPFFPVAKARRMAREFGGPVSFEVIAGAKVFPHEDHAADFAAHVEAFLGDKAADAARA
jgi:pimeloyl-ACP methyl ester carboxylesterase